MSVSVISEMRQLLVNSKARKLTKGEEKILAYVKRANDMEAFAGLDPSDKFVQRLADGGEIVYIRHEHLGAGWVIAGSSMDVPNFRATPPKR